MGQNGRKLFQNIKYYFKTVFDFSLLFLTTLSFHLASYDCICSVFNRKSSSSNRNGCEVTMNDFGS